MGLLNLLQSVLRYVCSVHVLMGTVPPHGGRAAAQALRRTFADVLSFVPFTVILVVPLTPLGHVLVFGFIQRYFPSFFPSQFNARRQAMLRRSETLRAELRRAQAAVAVAEARTTFRRRCRSSSSPPPSRLCACIVLPSLFRSSKARRAS